MKEENLKKLHETEIEILDAIVEICELHQLKYYLIGGTLLGAIRHCGFIPWDDDLDIAMPRRDYNRFLKIAKKELGSKFFLQTCTTDKNYGRLFSKVRKNNTLFMEADDAHIERHHGIFVDIFPLDSGGKFKENLSLTKKAAYYIDAYIQRKRTKLPGYEKKHILNLFPISFLSYVRDCLFAGYGEYYINYGSQYGVKKQTMKKDVYNPPTKVKFEEKYYAAPHNYEYVLKRIYGENYMQLPPIEKRVTHNPVKLNFDTTTIDERF